MREVLKNIFKITIFLFVFFVIYVVLTYMKKPENVDLRNITGFYAEEKNTLDMVYIGGSAAFVYWQPLKAYEEYGIASYNFATNSIQVELYKYMIKEVMKRQNPKLLVLDARGFQYRDYDLKPKEASYRNVLTGTPLNKDKIEFIENNIPKYLKEETTSYKHDLFLYHTVLENRNFENIFNMIFNKNKNDLKGFYFVPNAKRMKKLRFRTDKVTSPSWTTINILNDLLEYLNTLDIEVLFIVSPYIEMEEEKEIFNCIELIIEKAGYNFVDSNEYYKDMKIDYDTDFYDYNHMNIYGSDKYTEFLSEYIEENYDLLDRRKDKKYSDWNELLPEWNLKKEETKKEIDKIIEGKYYDQELFIKEKK